jgi:hypothetical protein
VDREELIEHSGYSRAFLDSLERDRQANGHPQARYFGGFLHWDLRVWSAWFTKLHDQTRDPSGVDRSGYPDDQLPPLGQARVLGVSAARIARYAKNPPPEWPDPVRVEGLPTRTREYRTRAQLWAWADNPASGFGTGGGRPSGPDVKVRAAKAKAPDPRVRLAAEALAAEPGRKAGEVAATLADRHGQSVATWKRIVTQARKSGRQ